MKVYFDKVFNQWCAEELNDDIATAAWGDTKEEAIERFNKI